MRSGQAPRRSGAFDLDLESCQRSKRCVGGREEQTFLGQCDRVTAGFLHAAHTVTTDYVSPGVRGQTGPQGPSQAGECSGQGSHGKEDGKCKSGIWGAEVRSRGLDTWQDETGLWTGRCWGLTTSSRRNC